MRIGIDARFYGGEQSKGLGRYTQKLIEQLAQEDTENEYIIFLQEDGFKNWNNPNKNFIPVLAPYRWYTLAEQIYMPRVIKKAQVDIMHFPHFNVPLLYRKPFIVTIHDLIILRFPTQRATTLGPLLYALKHAAGKLVMRHAAYSSEHIITVSEFSKKDIIDYYHIAPEKITVTYEAAESSEKIAVNDQSSEVLQKYAITKPYLLYVGNAYPHKNLEALLSVMALMKKMQQTQHESDTLPYQLVFVGKQDYFYERLVQQTQQMGLQDSVQFAGFVPDADLPSLYTNAFAYIFPSLYEGFGLPPLEAMHYGTPVLASTSSCLPEILGDAALYFNPKDISDILHAVETLSQNTDARTALIEKGYTQIQKYSWQKMMQHTREIYLHHLHLHLNDTKQKKTKKRS